MLSINVCRCPPATLPCTRVHRARALAGSPVESRSKLTAGTVRCKILLRTRATDPEKEVASVTDGAANVPLRQENPKLWIAFLAANLSVHAAGITIALTVSNDASNEFFLALAKINSEVAVGEYWRLLTATFMHAGLLHLGANCGALWVIGPEAEAVYGMAFFAAIFLLTGTAGNVASFLVDDLVTVGASGAIFGLLGAIFAYFLRNPKLQQSSTQFLVITGVVGFNVLLGFDEGGMIDNTGHIAGFLSGLWLGWYTCPRWQVLPGKDPEPRSRTFDWSAPTAPGPRSTSAGETSTSSTNTIDNGGHTAEAEPAAPASPTIALLDSLLAGADAAVDAKVMEKKEPESTSASHDPSKTSSSTIDALDSLLGIADKDDKAAQGVNTSGGSEQTAVSAAQSPATAADSVETGDKVGAAHGETLDGAAAGQLPAGGDEVAASQPKVIDSSRANVGWSVLGSFGLSLAVLAWAGTIALSAPKML